MNQRMTHADQVQVLLEEHGELSMKQLVEMTGMKKPSIRSAVSGLLVLGDIVNRQTIAGHNQARYMLCENAAPKRVAPERIVAQALRNMHPLQQVWMP
jgi:predicted transcriptional regulator